MVCREPIKMLIGAPADVVQEIARQMRFEVHDRCQRQCQQAAHEFLMAADEARMLPWAMSLMKPGEAELFRNMIDRRVSEAEARCVALHMWPADRPLHHPELFRANGKAKHDHHHPHL